MRQCLGQGVFERGTAEVDRTSRWPLGPDVHGGNLGLGGPTEAIMMAIRLAG